MDGAPAGAGQVDLTHECPVTKLAACGLRTASGAYDRRRVWPQRRGQAVQVDENETISHTLSKPSSGAALDTHNKATPAIIGNDDGKKAGRAAGPVKQLSKYHTAKLIFTASPNLKQIKGFATSVVPIVCGGGFSGPVTKLVSIGASSATITNSGEFQGKLVLHGTNGEESTTTLAGKFTSAKTASGKVTYKVGGCNVTEPFTARKK